MTTLDSKIGLPNFNKWEEIVINRLVVNGINNQEMTCVLEKLTEWLQAVECRFPSNSDDLATESNPHAHLKQNFGRIWKLLTCSVLIAKDDDTAKLISTAVSTCSCKALSEKPNLLALFTESLLVVLIEEKWILPMLKALPTRIMLVSHFVHSIFEILSRHQWRDDYVDSLITTIRVHLFNHHPPPPRSTRAASKMPQPFLTPLDLQVRLTRVILEEFPNSHPKILKFLSLFLDELIVSKSEEFAEMIQRSMSRHFCSPINTTGEGDTMKSLESSLQDIELDDKEVSEAASAPVRHESVLDPTTLSKCHDDFQDISAQLRKALISLRHGNAGKKTGMLIQELLQKFEHMIKLCDTTLVSSSTITPCGGHTTPVATSIVVSGARKRKMKAKPRLLPKGSTASGVTGMCEAKWSSPYLNDPELLDHIEDNYISYLVEIDRTISTSYNGNHEGVPEDKDNDEPVRKQPRISRNMLEKPRRNLKFVPEAEVVSTEENYVNNNNEDFQNVNLPGSASKSEANASTKHEHLALKTACLMTEKHKSFEAVTPKKRKFCAESLDVFEVVAIPAPKGNSNPSPISKFFTENINSGISFTNVPFPKEVRFVLATNLEHEDDDYENSVGRNPTPPFNGNRLPKRSLLKNKPKPLPPIRHWKKAVAAAAVAAITP